MLLAAQDDIVAPVHRVGDSSFFAAVACEAQHQRLVVGAIHMVHVVRIERDAEVVVAVRCGGATRRHNRAYIRLEGVKTAGIHSGLQRGQSRRSRWALGTERKDLLDSASWSVDVRDCAGHLFDVCTYKRFAITFYDGGDDTKPVIAIRLEYWLLALEAFQGLLHSSTPGACF